MRVNSCKTFFPEWKSLCNQLHYPFPQPLISAAHMTYGLLLHPHIDCIKQLTLVLGSVPCHTEQILRLQCFLSTVSSCYLQMINIYPEVLRCPTIKISSFLYDMLKVFVFSWLLFTRESNLCESDVLCLPLNTDNCVAVLSVS